MDKNEIKKALYKQKPEAFLLHIRGGKAYYRTIFMLDEDATEQTIVNFEIPLDDMGDATLYPEMDGKLLIRYIMM